MTLYEEITKEYEEEKSPYTYSLSKFADETISLYKTTKRRRRSSSRYTDQIYGINRKHK